jgi:alkylation response protein AidB-like acyl-CoA dehydrogenase
MEMNLTGEEAKLIDAARDFRDRTVASNAARWERERRLPTEALREAAMLGLTGIEVPRELGGQGARFSVKVRIADELSEACMAFAFSLLNTQNMAAKIARSGKPALCERYLPSLLRAERIGATALTEPGAGSDFAAIQTRAEKVPGGWRLNGEKAWITNAAAADLILTYAQTDPELGGRGIAGFLVDASRPGFARRPPFALMGGHAIGTGGFALENYFVGDEEVLHAAGQGFKEALRLINGARTYVAAMCCGMLAGALKTALRYGVERHAFGKPLIEHQGLKWKLADVATDLEAARLLAYKAAAVIDAGGDAMLAAAQAKQFAGRIIVERLSDCMQAMGAEGLREEYPIGRHIASGRIANYVDGTTEMQSERIGAVLLTAYGPRA